MNILRAEKYMCSFLGTHVFVCVFYNPPKLNNGTFYFIFILLDNAVREDYCWNRKYDP